MKFRGFVFMSCIMYRWRISKLMRLRRPLCPAGQGTIAGRVARSREGTSQISFCVSISEREAIPESQRLYLP